MFCSNTLFDGKIFTFFFQFPNIFWKFSFLFMTYISEWHVMIVIPCFKFVLRRPKVVLSWICGLLVPDTQNTFRDSSRPLGNLLCLYNYIFGLVVQSFGKLSIVDEITKYFFPIVFLSYWYFNIKNKRNI